MKKRNLLSFFLIHNFIYCQDKTAISILKNLNDFYKSSKNIVVNFNFFITDNENKTSDLINGILYIENDNFRLDINDQVIINNSKTQWIYLKDVNEVQIMDHNSDDIPFQPKDIFNISENDYKVLYIGETEEQMKKYKKIELFPRQSKPFIKMQLYIDNLNQQIFKCIMFDKNGGTQTYLIKELQQNIKLKPFTFNINDYPDIEVIDLR